MHGRVDWDNTFSGCEISLMKGGEMTKPQIIAVTRCILGDKGEMSCMNCMFKKNCDILNTTITKLLDKELLLTQ